MKRQLHRSVGHFSYLGARVLFQKVFECWRERFWVEVKLMCCILPLKRSLEWLIMNRREGPDLLGKKVGRAPSSMQRREPAESSLWNCGICRVKWKHCLWLTGSVLTWTDLFWSRPSFWGCDHIPLWLLKQFQPETPWHLLHFLSIARTGKWAILTSVSVSRISLRLGAKLVWWTQDKRFLSLKAVTGAIFNDFFIFSSGLWVFPEDGLCFRVWGQDWNFEAFFWLILLMKIKLKRWFMNSLLPFLLLIFEPPPVMFKAFPRILWVRGSFIISGVSKPCDRGFDPGPPASVH